MDGNNQIDPEAAVIIVVSSVGSIIGVITLLFFMSNAFYNFNCWFFVISLLSQLFCLYIDYKSNKRHTAPKPIQFNPHFHNALVFACFALTSTTSILYIFDGIILHLYQLSIFFPIKEVKKTLSQLTESKSMKNILNYVEILVVPELFLWLIVNHTFGILVSFITYIVLISMFSYVVSHEAREIWVKIYSIIRKQYRNNTGVLKSIFEVIVSICDFFSNASHQLYKAPPLKTVF
ncbi:hypothetical protein TRFO_20356 [Tritrichomonas foetus]|uniref:Uncharacterized protein n=1 Tax=Tritrichomonas foetus TaxID=1144522 RepID=A0A1J4KHH1_9EUKA|nr:hypothetical protein TRFO_20356 [Tritrichomonas foetus]|eukprot:OHT10392.1 hypothetical protein TRFO_20356 [Tritrichomonas foetus]